MSLYVEKFPEKNGLKGNRKVSYVSVEFKQGYMKLCL